MKAEAISHTPANHGAARAAASRGTPAADTQGGDRFAQLLANLRADDETLGLEPDSQRVAGDDAAANATALGAGDADALLARDRAAQDVMGTENTSQSAVLAAGLALGMPMSGPTTGNPAAPDGDADPILAGAGDATPGVDAPGLLPSGGESPHPIADLARQTGLGQDKSAAEDAPFGQWVSTVARSKARTNAPGRPHAAGAPASADDTARVAPALPNPADGVRVHRGPGEPMAAAPTLPSTALASAADAMATRRDPDRGHTDGTAATGGSGPGAQTADPSPSASAQPEGQDFGLHLGQALGEAFESIGAQVSLWAAGRTQRASFSVEDGLDDPLNVDVSVTDGVAQLSFRTDDGALRQMIQAQAPSALADALARAGLTLGGVDVGGQSDRQPAAHPDGARARTTRVGLVGATDTSVHPAAATLTRPRSERAGLDVYA